MKPFFLVLARDERYVDEKIEELKRLGVPYLVVCGKKLNHPNVVYREPKGKYDAINFGFRFIPKDVDVVALNDVDTKISNFEAAIKLFNSKDVALVFAKVLAEEGPQNMFLNMLRALRRKLPIAASGDLMLVRYDVLKKVLPLKPCKAEDSYLLFKVLELGYKVADCPKCSVIGKKTKMVREEESYKRRTVCGIYQALHYSKPPGFIRLFYMLLPMISPILLVSGKTGYFWMKGILLGLIDFLRGDRTGVWQPA
ncbi:MAG: hypothetical protein QXF61_06985 [Nitrososphaeria archaeon]